MSQYRHWIEATRERQMALSPKRKETAEQLLSLADFAARRIESGIETLARDADALDAFRVANRAVAGALRQRLKIDSPSWKAFQLAFILVNLPGLADPGDPNRETVDLRFFPTGGTSSDDLDDWLDLWLNAFRISITPFSCRAMRDCTVTRCPSRGDK